MTNKKTLLVGMLLFLIGVGVLVGDFLVVKSTITFLSNSEKAEGSVTNIVQSRSSDGNYMYSPEVSFTDNSGKTITFKSNISSSISSYQQGEKVAVLYNKANPQNAKINTFLQLWFAPIVMTVLGGVFFLIGFFTLLDKKRKGNLQIIN